MSRRRLKMLLESEPDLLEGYRLDNISSTYNLRAEWQADDMVVLEHTRAGFYGPSFAAKNFIGSGSKASTDVGYVLDPRTKPMTTLQLWHTYRLTLTVVEVLNNTATPENDGDLYIGFGSAAGHKELKRPLSEVTVGTQFSITMTYETWATISGAAFGASNASLVWGFRFKVELEEV